ATDLAGFLGNLFHFRQDMANFCMGFDHCPRALFFALPLALGIVAQFTRLEKQFPYLIFISVNEPVNDVAYLTLFSGVLPQDVFKEKEIGIQPLLSPMKISQRLQYPQALTIATIGGYDVLLL